MCTPIVFEAVRSVRAGIAEPPLNSNQAIKNGDRRSSANQSEFENVIQVDFKRVIRRKRDEFRSKLLLSQ